VLPTVTLNAAVTNRARDATTWKALFFSAIDIAGQIVVLAFAGLAGTKGCASLDSNLKRWVF